MHYAFLPAILKVQYAIFTFNDNLAKSSKNSVLISIFYKNAVKFHPNLLYIPDIPKNLVYPIKFNVGYFKKMVNIHHFYEISDA